MRKEVTVMNNECGCVEHPVWSVLDALGVQYERVAM